MKTVRKKEKIYKNKFFNDSFFAKKIKVSGKDTKEIINITYTLNKPVIEEELVKLPIDEEYIERKFIIDKSIEMYDKYLSKDMNTRRASFVNNYDGNDNHCISYFHYYIRDNKLNLNVYARSMNFETNFICDNQTFILAYNSIFEKLDKKYNIEKGDINVNIFSLHIIL
jgi:hypothetical protein